MTWTKASRDHEENERRAESNIQMAEKIAKSFRKCSTCGDEFIPFIEGEKNCQPCIMGNGSLY